MEKILYDLISKAYGNISIAAKVYLSYEFHKSY